MIALIDTHTLRWWLDDPGRLSTSAGDLLSDKSNSLVISAVVPWELAIKTNLGKLEATPFLTRWPEMLEVQGFTELPVDSQQAIRAGMLPRHHRDPFDRMLIAQAQVTGWPIVSADPVFEHYGVRRIW